jgi:hypothetical protein
MHWASSTRLGLTVNVTNSRDRLSSFRRSTTSSRDGLLSVYDDMAESMLKTFYPTL